MHLNNKQLSILSIPFIVAAILFVFNDTIAKQIHLMSIDQKNIPSLSALDKKTLIYLDIESKERFYRDLEAKMAARDSNATWITDAALYKAFKDKKKEILQKDAWSLQLVYPKKNIAIINGKVTALDEMVDGAKLIKICKLKVLLQHDEGKVWVTLFQ